MSLCGVCQREPLAGVRAAGSTGQEARRRQAEGGYNHDLAKRGRALQGVGLSSMRFHPTGRGREDDEDGQEGCSTTANASLIG